VVTLLLLHALGTLDGAFAGFRTMAGRCGRVRRGWVTARALAWGAAWAQPALLAVEGLGLGVATCAEVDLARLADAGWAMAAVYLVYAGGVGVAYALRLVPSVDVVAATSVLLFGPLTLLRPVVLVAGGVAAWWAYPSAPVGFLGVAVVLAAGAVGRGLASGGERWRD
jgi:hypothetical protein